MDIVIKRENVNTDKFSPKVLNSYLFTQGRNYAKDYKLKERYVYDYEIEFFVFSEGSMVIDQQNYEISKGDIVFRRPGQYTQATMPYCCYLICFDLLGDTGKEALSYDLYKKQEFQKNYKNNILDSLPTISHPPFYDKYQNLFDRVLKEFINQRDSSDLILKSTLLRIIYELYEDVTNLMAYKNNVAFTHFVSIKNVKEFIDQNIESKITLNDLGNVAKLSPTYFHKVFTETVGITPNEYVMKVRLEKAKELLVRTDLTIYEIALKCGYDNIPYFSHSFKQKTSISPSEFRKKHSYFI